MTGGEFIQYGCGWSAPQGWRNFDASPTLRFERIPLLGSLYSKNKNRFPTNVEYGDIVKGLPVNAESVDGIYCSHVLEHLSLSDFRRALLNTHKLLKSGGTFRLVLPDLKVLANKYLEDEDENAAIKFIAATGMGCEHRARGVKASVISYLGNSRHLWMWDFPSIRNELTTAGFVNIRLAIFGDSSIQEFGDVEEASRWADALGIECQRPE